MINILRRSAMPLSINEQSAVYVTLTFTDEDERAMVPTSADWRLDDKPTDTEIVDWTALTPAASIDLIIPGANNTMITPGSSSEIHVLTIRMNGGLDTEAYEEYEYTVVNLGYVP